MKKVFFINDLPENILNKFENTFILNSIKQLPIWILNERLSPELDTKSFYNSEILQYDIIMWFKLQYDRALKDTIEKILIGINTEQFIGSCVDEGVIFDDETYVLDEAYENFIKLVYEYATNKEVDKITDTKFIFLITADDIKQINRDNFTFYLFNENVDIIKYIDIELQTKPTTSQDVENSALENNMTTENKTNVHDKESIEHSVKT